MVGGLAAGGDGREAVRLYDADSHLPVLTLAARGSIFQRTAFSPDGTVLAASNEEGELHLWRAPSWAEIEAAGGGRGRIKGAGRAGSCGCARGCGVGSGAVSRGVAGVTRNLAVAARRTARSRYPAARAVCRAGLLDHHAHVAELLVAAFEQVVDLDAA